MSMSAEETLQRYADDSAEAGYSFDAAQAIAVLRRNGYAVVPITIDEGAANKMLREVLTDLLECEKDLFTSIQTTSDQFGVSQSFTMEISSDEQVWRRTMALSAARAAISATRAAISATKEFPL